jgi:hypothetical protein
MEARPLIPLGCLLLVTILASLGSGAGTEIAHGRPATASGSYLSSLPDSAFDGDTATAWNSGNHAPQWIEVDLGADFPITEFDGCADITPNGQVTHIVEGRSSFGTTYVIGSYAGSSVRNQWLSIPCDPSHAVRYVRVTTTSSPSWIAWFELKVYSDQPVPAQDRSWGALKRRYR